jgi:hypothetical protein
VAGPFSKVQTVGKGAIHPHFASVSMIFKGRFYRMGTYLSVSYTEVDVLPLPPMEGTDLTDQGKKE